MKITLIAGSNRAGASSTMMLKYIDKLLQEGGIQVATIDLRELPLPLFTPDNWDFHANAKSMLEHVADSDGLVLSTPEYHGSLSGMLKNALDYMSPALVAGRTVLSVSAAGGPIGVSSLTQLQSIVRALHGINSPEWISVGAGCGFEPDGTPSDEDLRQRVDSAVGKFVELTGAIAARKATAV